MADLEFHEIAFAVPLLAFSLSALVRGHLKAAVLWALPLVFVKEDQGFTVAALGLYLTLAGMRAARDPGGTGGQTADLDALPQAADPDGSRRIKAGQFLLIWGFAGSFLAIGLIIPHLNPAHQYDYWSDGGIPAPRGPPTRDPPIRPPFHPWPHQPP